MEFYYSWVATYKDNRPMLFELDIQDNQSSFYDIDKQHLRSFIMFTCGDDTSIDSWSIDASTGRFYENGKDITPDEFEPYTDLNINYGIGLIEHRHAQVAFDIQGNETHKVSARTMGWKIEHNSRTVVATLTLYTNKDMPKLDIQIQQ